MRQFIILGIIAFIAFSCSDNQTALIDAKINNASEKNIVISKLDINQMKVLDTVKTKGDGSFKYRVKIKDKSPNFYYISYNNNKLANLILKPGDKVKILVDTLGKDLNIQGSKESILLERYNTELNNMVSQFNSKGLEMEAAANNKDTLRERILKQEMGQLYVKYRQNAIKNIISNPYSFANISILYQYVTPSLPVFFKDNDVLYIKRVYDSLKTVYPNSNYIKVLLNQITEAKKLSILNEKIINAEESSFPNISLPDINAKERELLQLQGKPFMLMFWSVTDTKQKMFNNDLKEIYKKYNPKGFEIYQICIDSDKTAWATTVKEQELPWICVCDGLGINSTVLPLFNVRKVPMLYIFNKDGDIIAKDIYDLKELSVAIEKSFK